MTSDPGLDDDGDDIGLFDILTQLYSRKWRILLATFLGAVVGVFYGQLAPNQYRAEAVIHVEQNAQSIVLPEEVVGEAVGGRSASRGLNTEIHIIRSQLTLGPVVNRLHLDWQVAPNLLPVVGHLAERRALPFFTPDLLPEYVRYGDRLELADLQVPDTLTGQRIEIRAQGDGRFTATLPGYDPVDGQVGQPLKFPDRAVSLTLKTLEAPAGRLFWVWREPVHVGVARLRGRLTISERFRSAIVDFRYTDPDRDRAREIVNAVIDSYQDQNLQRRSAEIDQSIAFIDEQLPAIRETLNAATEALRQYQLTRQETELSLGTQDLLSQAVALEAELEELAFREKQLAERITPNHPDYRALLLQRDRVTARLDELRAEIDALPEAEQELLQLTEDVSIARQVEAKMSERGDQLRVLKASTISNVVPLELAVAARQVGPDRRTPAVIGLALGLILAAGLVIAINMLRRGIDDAGAIEALGLPLFATVGRVKALAFGGRNPALYSLAENDPQNLVVEALRGLRTGLQFSLATAPHRSLMITSCAPGDGKSFVALNLATVWGQAGEKVLLIDTDMRRGVLRRNFDLPKKPRGLSDYLAGRAALEEVVHTDTGKQIDFIAAGSYPPNPSELLAAPAFEDLLARAHDAYDIVIVDAPPALAVTDPGIIGQKIGMSLMVVRHLITSPAEVKAALKILAASGVEPSGSIISQFNATKSRYGRDGAKYRYYGGYRYKYGSGSDS